MYRFRVDKLESICYDESRIVYIRIVNIRARYECYWPYVKFCTRRVMVGLSEGVIFYISNWFK